MFEPTTERRGVNDVLSYNIDDEQFYSVRIACGRHWSHHHYSTKKERDTIIKVFNEIKGIKNGMAV